MNETVLSLALQTAILIEAECSEQLHEVQTHTASRYFARIGQGNLNVERLTEAATSLEIVVSKINSILDSYEKVYMLLLVQECLFDMHLVSGFDLALQKLFKSIGIDSKLVTKFRDFLTNNELYEINTREFLLLSPQNSMDNEMLEGRWIEDNVPKGKDFSGTLKLDQLNSHLIVMFVDQIRSYMVRCMNSNEKIFDQDAESLCHFRLLKPGQELSIDGVSVLTFSDLKSRFLQISEKRELTLSIDEIQYVNADGLKEIHKFSAVETTGRLIGIVGREGVGKSTLLKLLAGKSKPTSGKIAINGYDLWKNKYLLKGVIGFVPEEDLLFEELTVGDNLMLTARLYYSNLGKKEIEAKVNALLSSIDLLDIKHMVVGNADNKQIQPGQRRLVNIALELLREPQILLVDNALSGLGMSDACRVIKILHNYSFSGNLVITSISQVDSDTFMLFDKIWIMDEAGYPVYNGPVKYASGYLFKTLQMVVKENDTIDPARLLDWVYYRLPDKNSHVWKRVVEPQTWHDQFMREQALQNSIKPLQTRLPARILKIPNLEIQLLIFSIRNFKIKFSKGGEIVKTLVSGPIAALLLSLLLRTGTEENYTFLSNGNIPIYQFISVVMAIFLGLIASVDEIIREKNIVEKEEYLEFSRFSYLNSKIIYIFPVIAVQILLYLITANLILGIKEMLWLYWVVLFSSGAFGVLLGLMISSDFKTRHVIDKVILPIIIALQLLLGGGIITYDRLNLGDHKYTPLVGDLMVSRWGYEILAVEHFKKNSFERLVYPFDQKLDQAAFYAFQAIPRLEQSFVSCMSSTDEDSIRHNVTLLQNEFNRAATIPDVSPFEYLAQMADIREKEKVAEEVSGYLTYLSYHFHDQYDTVNLHRTTHIGLLVDSLGASGLARLRQDYHNLSLQETVTQSNAESTYKVIDDQIIRKSGMIFDTPRSQWGRAAFFSPLKLFHLQQTETVWFNLSVIWFMTSLCYVWVLFDITGILKKLFRFR
jgi:ABC-type multidrug transport system ATPase subunit